jgi:hypothetical protein
MFQSHVDNMDEPPQPIYQFSVRPCQTCGGSTEVTFLCDDCGARRTMKLRNGDEVVRHEAGCRYQEYCMARVDRGSYHYGEHPVCRNPVVEKFDVNADGRPVGFCGVHARGQADAEKNAYARKERRELDAWRYELREKKEATEAEIIAQIAAILGYPEGEFPEVLSRHNSQREVIQVLALPISVLQRHFGLFPPEPENPVSTLKIEDDAGPDPF